MFISLRTSDNKIIILDSDEMRCSNMIQRVAADNPTGPILVNISLAMFQNFVRWRNDEKTRKKRRDTLFPWNPQITVELLIASSPTMLDVPALHKLSIKVFIEMIRGKTKDECKALFQINDNENDEGIERLLAEIFEALEE